MPAAAVRPAERRYSVRPAGRTARRVLSRRAHVLSCPDTANHEGDSAMASILQSLERTIAAGVVLLIVIIVAAGLISGSFVKLDSQWWVFFMLWLHVISGVMWI